MGVVKNIIAKETKTYQLKKEYYKARKRLLNQLSRLRKLGFKFSGNTLPKIPKKITRSSIDRLNKITTDRLINKSLKPKWYNSKEVKKKGLKQVLKEERKRLKEEIEIDKSKKEDEQFERYDTNAEDFDSQRRHQDIEDRKQAETDASYSLGEIIEQQLYAKIEQAENEDGVRGGHKMQGRLLRDVYEREIKQYGREAVLRSLANAPEQLLELADKIINYDPNTPQHQANLVAFVELLTGTVLTMDEINNLYV